MVRISPEQKAYVRLLREEGVAYREIARRSRVALSSVHRICSTPLRHLVRRNRAGGRPRSLSRRQERALLRNLNKLRMLEGNFSSRRLMEVSGLNNLHVSDRTIRRALNRHGYRYLQSRKKGLLTKADFASRVAFAKRVRQQYARDLFTHQIAFYLDGTSFVFKTNPLDQACAPRGRVWRKRSEGLALGCTAKGSKVGTGGRVVKLMVAISYNEGVVVCEPYQELNGDYFADFIRRKFVAMFARADKEGSRLFVQDGDPSQNSRAARDAMREVQAELFPIPARSPDLNPIENIFKLVGDRLRADAVRHHITRETFQGFQARVIATIRSIPVATIDRTIASMDSRISLILQSGGRKTRY